MKRIFLIFVLVLMLLAACDLLREKFSSRIIEHDPLSLSFDNSFFENKGCFQSISCLPESLLSLDPPIDYLMRLGPSFGGLDPQLPMISAITNSADGMEESNFLYSGHCLESHYIRYIVYAGNEYHLVSSSEELAALFAPIESPEEALSFAIAATGYSPVNDLEKIKKLKLEQDTVEETFVQPVENGYLVHLFNTFMCGCGPHVVPSVDVTVHFDGTLEIADPVPAYQDRETEKICFD